MFINSNWTNQSSVKTKLVIRQKMNKKQSNVFKLRLQNTFLSVLLKNIKKAHQFDNGNLYIIKRLLHINFDCS